MRRPALAIVWYACALHYLWGLLLIISETATRSTPVHAIAVMFGGRWGALVAVLAVAMAAQAAPLAEGWLLPALLFPQLFLLVVSASGALHAAFVGHYADGVPRPWPFILSDQLPVILAAALYAAALIGIRSLGRKG